MLNHKFGYCCKGLICLRTWCHGRWGHFAFGRDMTWQPDGDLLFHLGETPFTVVWWWKCTTSLATWKWLSPEISAACKLGQEVAEFLVADCYEGARTAKELCLFPFEVEESCCESLHVFFAAQWEKTTYISSQEKNLHRWTWDTSRVFISLQEHMHSWNIVLECNIHVQN